MAGNGRRVMKRLMLTTVLVFGGMPGAACARDTDVFRDSLRPGGHDRSMAAKFADARRCGATRQHTFTDGPAFQQCMRSRGWVLDHVVADRSATFIDPDTGLSCYNQGGASFCESPQGTVKYTNKYGLSCTRSRMMNICSNL
jgi:hypothetical protein